VLNFDDELVAVHRTYLRELDGRVVPLLAKFAEFLPHWDGDRRARRDGEWHRRGL
jgi:hypothetical protein